MGAYCIETGKWWRVEFDESVQTRLRSVEERDEISINVLELLGMVVTAWAFVTLERARPRFRGESLLMKGDNMSAIHWISRCRGGRDPRSAALMRILGGLKVSSGWCFHAKHVAGIDNVIADGISRWTGTSITDSLRKIRPDIHWQEQSWGQAGIKLCSGILAPTSSGAQLRSRLNTRTRQVSSLGPHFKG